MNKTKILVLSLTAALGVVGTAGALANYTAEKEVVNNTKTDTVDIELKEYQIDDNSSLSEFVNPVNQVPGATVSKIPKIYNKGSDCWLRVKIDFDIDDKELETIDIDNLNGFEKDNWVFCKDDGYWYLKESLKEETNIDVFESVTIPSEWGNEYKDKNIYIDITAEAIQTKNFTPNYESNKPWGDEKAEECVRSRDFERKDGK